MVQQIQELFHAPSQQSGNIVDIKAIVYNCLIYKTLLMNKAISINVFYIDERDLF